VTTPEIVAIGASLGGLIAVERLLKALPADFRCPIVIVQHRRPDTDNRLVELLRKHSSLPVSEPEDKAPIEQGHVYVAPSDYHLLVEDGLLALSIDSPVLYARPSIDVLFESVADAYDSRSVGVVLTCASEDGAAGARALKNAGARVLVQDPATAESPVAVKAVLAQIKVDLVADIEGLAEWLIRECR
jgi:two-component system, chemotaxis family, protein-glutamate methylesterase/glutaminase